MRDLSWYLKHNGHIGGVNMNRFSLKDRGHRLGRLAEGNSLRSLTRMTGKSINTVTKLLVDLGTACAIYQTEELRNLPCKRVQVDEIWSFCYAKAKHIPKEERHVLGTGDVYTWV